MASTYDAAWLHAELVRNGILTEDAPVEVSSPVLARRFQVLVAHVIGNVGMVLSGDLMLLERHCALDEVSLEALARSRRQLERLSEIGQAALRLPTDNAPPHST